jgi:hypothetical protein
LPRANREAVAFCLRGILSIALAAAVNAEVRDGGRRAST